jgi:hypothetical protein
MGHRPQHRGAHPEDARLFGAGALPTLGRAAEEVAWLLGRDYAMDPAVEAVGNHHQLALRQRLALKRACCSEAARASRRARRMAPEAVRGAALLVDGFNLIITLEVALSRGLLLEGRDGALRDLGGLRGSYHLVDETEPALELLGDELGALGAAGAHVYLEQAVANSGRLRARLVEAARGFAVPVEVELVRNADPLLAGRAAIVTADAALLDGCVSWANLGAWIVHARIPDAWVVRLDAPRAEG